MAHVPVRAYGCFLLLSPILPYNPAPPWIYLRLEYLGRADDGSSPCASTGLPGAASSTGPQVPALKL